MATPKKLTEKERMILLAEYRALPEGAKKRGDWYARKTGRVKKQAGAFRSLCEKWGVSTAYVYRLVQMAIMEPTDSEEGELGLWAPLVCNAAKLTRVQEIYALHANCAASALALAQKQSV